MQAGESATSQEANVSSCNTPTGEDPSQAGNNPLTQAGRQAVRHSARCRASQGNDATPQASSTSPWEGTHPYPQVFPKGLPQKILTLSGSLTYPANL